MGRSAIRLAFDIAAPQDFVFERIIDHEAMARWPGTSSCVLLCEGNPRNGVGAVRKIRAAGLTVHEEVTRFDPPHGYDYTIIKGLPVEHVGRVRVVPLGDTSRLEWHIELSSKIPLFSQCTLLAARIGLRRALTFFVHETERAAQDA